MRSSRPEFERFLRKVHLRFIALRLVEQTALGLLAGCAVGLPLVVIAILRSVPAGPLAAGGLAFGAVGGFVYGLLHRPTLHDTAAEADWQLDTSDLLGTALRMRHDPDPWAGAVVATANAWVRSAEPSSVLLNRLGARAWGGIGLATALLAVLTLLPTYASPIQAADRTQGRSNETGDGPTYSSTVNPHHTAPDQQPEDLHSNHDNTAETSTRPTGSADAVADPKNTNSASDPARGRGETHTLTHSPKAPIPSDATLARNSSPNGRSADGAGQTARDAAAGSSNASQSTGLTPANAAEPWKSAQWPQQARQALHAVDSGQVPDSYSDVIHGYFDRH